MRLVVGIVLVMRAAPWLLHPPTAAIAIRSGVITISGLFLICGLWTPVAGVSIAVIALWDVIAGHEQLLAHLLAGTIAASLAMLGPGRWSIDARLFGWRRIDPLPRQRNSTSI
jgi:uncharacterized membrane protein YphA (DoxX/SURF4 family)